MALMRNEIGHFTGNVNGRLTGCAKKSDRSCSRAMDTPAVLERIEERLRVVGLSADAASRLANAPDAIRNLRRAVKSGTRTGVTITTLAALAPVLQTTVGHLLEGDEPPALKDPFTNKRVRPVSIPVAGKLAAGVFREVIEHEDADVEYIFDEPDPDFPNAKLIAFTVEGDSLNDLKPRPILDGDTLICVDFDDAGVPLSTGMLVVVQRTRDNGITLEWSAKQVEMTRGGVVLHPRSTNKNYKSFTIPLIPPDEGDERIKVIALVRRTSYKIARPGKGARSAP